MKAAFFFLERMSLPSFAEDVLLNDFDYVFAHAGDNGDVAVAAVLENEEVVFGWWDVATILKLPQVAGFIELTVNDLRIKKIAGVTPDIGH